MAPPETRTKRCASPRAFSRDFGLLRWDVRLAVASVFLALSACSRATPDTAPTAAPASEPAPEDGEFEFVSTEHNDEDEGERTRDDTPKYDKDYAITTAVAAKELADESVADRLNPRQTWEASPVLPTSWPEPGKTVVVYFYPLAANPSSLSHFQLFSAAWAVTISLEDGSAEVTELKTKKLGTVQMARPSRLEREELELAEKALVHYLLSGDSDDGENAFWGYLKFVHEHPEIGRDLEKRAPKFMAWLRAKNPRGRS
jgi:hypothetical protein